MNKILLFHQFLGGSKKPNVIIQYYADEKIPFLQNQLKDFYIFNGDGNNPEYFKGELLSDVYNETDHIGTYYLYTEQNILSNIFYSKFLDIDNYNACTKICTFGTYYDITTNTSDVINSDMILVLPDSIEHLPYSIDNTTNIIIKSLPTNLKTIGYRALSSIFFDNLVIPETVTIIDACFSPNLENKNIYFVSSTPPTLTHEYGLDISNNSNNNICIPISYKDEYLNSDFKKHENVLNFNKIIANGSHNSYLILKNDLNEYRCEYYYYLFSDSDITEITIGNYDNSNGLTLHIPPSVKEINIERRKDNKQACHDIIIYGDVNITDPFEHEPSRQGLFYYADKIEFKEGVETLPQYGLNYNGELINGSYQFELILPKSIKTINSRFNFKNSPLYISFNGTCSDWAKIKFNNSPTYSHLSKVYLNFNKSYILEFKDGDGISYERYYAAFMETESINSYAFDNINIYKSGNRIYSFVIGKNVKKIGIRSFVISSNSQLNLYYEGTLDDWMNIESESEYGMFGGLDNYASICYDNRIFLLPSLELKSGNVHRFNHLKVTENVEVFNNNLNGFNHDDLYINTKIIKENTLNRCSELKTIELGTNVSEIEGAFTNTNVNITCIYQGSATNYYKIKGFDLHLGRSLQFNYSTGIVFDEDKELTYIDDRLRYKSTGETLSISKNITNIHEYAFNSMSPSKLIIFCNIIDQFKSTTLIYTDIQNLRLGTEITNITNIFKDCVNLTSITYDGTIEQWNAITKVEDWNENIPATVVTCSDGTVTIRETDN